VAKKKGKSVIKRKIKKTRTVAKKTKKKAKGPQIVCLGLGSNVGDREEYIEQAVFLLGKVKGIEVLKRSSNYETEAEGKIQQPSFINAAVEVKTTLSPHKLLEEIQGIENVLGREREIEWGPRTIDIDILLSGDQIMSEDNLQIPHPLLHERMFALLPLKEIVPQTMHPVLEKTVKDIFEEKKTELGETYDDELPGFKEIKGGSTDDYESWDYRK
jgi:2-amino-4-hydroxy-6-hydroxymethyldihydropteridine diphosphokinase